jgi:hypothetical protein
MRRETAEVIAQASTSLRVESMPDNRSDEPLEVGSIAMTAIPHLHPGDTVTPFDFTMLDGSIKSVTDFTGKHLLVVFVSPAEGFKPGVDAFKRLAADYANDPRLEVLWLIISTPDEAAACAENHGLSKDVASIASANLPNEYDALVLCAVLIDPAGKLVHKRMTVDVAKKHLRQALGAATTARK